MKQSSKQNRKTSFRICHVRGATYAVKINRVSHLSGNSKRLRPRIGPDKNHPAVLSGNNSSDQLCQRERLASKTSQFQASHAEEFVHYVRTIKVASNGHENSLKRPLLDKGIKYILQCCCSMFGYAIKRRHLSPYAENPFSCLDLKTGMLYIRNKPHSGWQVKTRNERKILLIDELRDVLKITVGDRLTGPVFLQRRYSSASAPPELNGQTEKQLEDLLQLRGAQEETHSGNARYPVEMFRYCDQMARLMNTFPTLRSIGSLPVWCRMQLTPATTLHYDYREKPSAEQSASAPVYMPWSLILILLVIKPFDFVYRTFRRLVKRTR